MDVPIVYLVGATTQDPVSNAGLASIQFITLLRLSIAAGNSAEAVWAIFKALWTTGANATDPGTIARLAESVGVDLERHNDASVKVSLRAHTDEAAAAAAGVFGVPSFLVNDQVLWGSDAIDFAADEIQRADRLPIGASRSGSH